MPTNLAIDGDLIAQVQKIGGHKTKKAAVNEALSENIRHRKQLELIDDFGTIDYDDLCDNTGNKKKDCR